MQTPRTAIVIAYRFFRAACSSAMLGLASVMSTGSGLRDRGDCWLEATGTIPPTARGPGITRRSPPVSPSMVPPAPGGGAVPFAGSVLGGRFLRRLRRLLLLLLEPANLGERLGPGDVGDRAPRALLAVGAGGLPPAGRGDPVLLSEEGEEDLRLLRAETGQLPQPPQERAAVGGVVPQGLGAAVVALDQQPAQLLGAAGHRARVAVQCRWPLEDPHQLLGVRV